MRIIGAVLVILFILLLWYNNLIGLLLVVPAVLLITVGVSGGDDRTVRNFAKMGVKFVDPVAMNGHDDEFLEWVKEPDNPNLTAGFINSTNNTPELSQSLMEHILGDGFRIYPKQICLNANYEFDPSNSNCMQQPEIDNVTTGIIKITATGHTLSIVIKDRVINIYEPNADKNLNNKIMDVFPKIFAKQIASGYVIKTLVDGVCPVKFQGLGGSGICQSYALYIAALKILNPTVDFNVIEKYLSHNKGRTQIHILRFMYYIYKTIIPKLRSKITVDDKYNSKYTNYVHGLYFPGIELKDTIEHKNVKCVINLYKIPYDISTASITDIEYLSETFIKLIEARKSNKGAIFNILKKDKAQSITIEDPELNIPLGILHGQIYNTRDDLNTVRRIVYDITLHTGNVKINNDKIAVLRTEIKDSPDKQKIVSETIDKLTLHNNIEVNAIKDYKIKLFSKLFE